MPKIDLSNKTFERLTVIELDKDRSLNDSKHQYWFCSCSCGNNNISIRQDHLLSGLSTSCGCYKDEKIHMARKHNIYEIKEDYVIGYSSNLNSTFYIDKEDYNIVKNHCWSENSSGYICSRINNKNIRLHRYVMKVGDEPIQIDHIDRNTRNNRKYNLRICTIQQNSYNKVNPKNNKSGFRGVFYREDKHKWQVKIKNKFIKYCDSYDEAVEIRLKMEDIYFGDFKPIMN